MKKDPCSEEDPARPLKPGLLDPFSLLALAAWDMMSLVSLAASARAASLASGSRWSFLLGGFGFGFGF